MIEQGKLTSETDQSKDELALADFIRRRAEEARQSPSRASHEALWMRNIAYILGYSGVRYDLATRTFRSLNNADRYVRRNRMHVNKILPTVQNRLARLCKSPPKYDIRPNSNDVDDKEACRLGLQIIDFLWDKEKLNKKKHELYMSLQQVGHSYLKVCWDPSMGNPMPNPETGEMDYEGDIRVDVMSGFEVFPDPMAKTFEEARWFIVARVRPLDYFREYYPEKGDLIKQEEAWLLSLQYEQRLNSLNAGNPTQGSMHQLMKNSAIELCYYERRSKKHPNGRQVIVANRVMLEDKELPVGEIPIVRFDDTLVAHKYYPESLVTHLIPLQDQYDRTITMRANWTNQMLAGKYIVARGSGLGQESFTNQSGEIIEYDPVPNAPPPTFLQPPAIPSYAYKEEESISNMFYDISGINEVARGTLPSASVPAAGMQILLEADLTRIGVVTERLEESWAQVGKLMLLYAQKNYVMPRMLKISGKNLEYTVKSFSGADIKNNTDVIVIRGSSLPNSKVMKRQEIINLHQQGYLGDPKDPKVVEKVLSMLEYGDIGEAWEENALDEAQVQKQIEMIEQGQPPELNEFDNHVLHAKEMNSYRKTDKFDKLPPEIKQLFMQVLESHMQEIQKQINPELGVQDQMVKPEEVMAASHEMTGATTPEGQEQLQGQGNPVQ